MKPNRSVLFISQELVVALSRFVQQFETQFTALAYQLLEEEKNETWNMGNKSGRSLLQSVAYFVSFLTFFRCEFSSVFAELCIDFVVLKNYFKPTVNLLAYHYHCTMLS